MPHLNIPSWLSVALGAAFGLLGALNVAAFGFGSPWTELVTFVCAAGASLGVSPLVHGALRNALHISPPLAFSIAGMLTTACAAVTAATLDDTVKGILVGVLTAAGGVLAGPDGAPAPTPPLPVPTPPTPSPAPPPPPSPGPPPVKA